MPKPIIKYSPQQKHYIKTIEPGEAFILHNQLFIKHSSAGEDSTLSWDMKNACMVPIDTSVVLQKAAVTITYSPIL